MVWQGFSLTIKSRNFVRTGFECGTGTPSVCTKLHHTSQSADRSDCKEFSSANSKRPIIFRHEISMGENGDNCDLKISRPPQTVCCRSPSFQIYGSAENTNHPEVIPWAAWMTVFDFDASISLLTSKVEIFPCVCVPFEILLRLQIYFESHRQF